MPVKEVLENYSKEQIKKAARIKAIFFDVDGVLTDGKITYDDTGREIKSFNVKDGHIISHLKTAGIVTGIITGRESATVSKRAAELKLDFCHQGIVDKLDTFHKLLKVYRLKAKAVAYVGDDLNDLGVMRACGLSACPSDALAYVQRRADVVTERRGGEGVVREVADMVLAARGLLGKILERS